MSKLSGWITGYESYCNNNETLLSSTVLYTDERMEYYWDASIPLYEHTVENQTSGGIPSFNYSAYPCFTARYVMEFGKGCSDSYVNKCIGTGYLDGEGDTCYGKYKKCICAEGWNWNGKECVTQNKITCQIGDLYYSQSGCSSKKLTETGENKFLGVVVYVKGNGHGLIMAPEIGAGKWSGLYEDLYDLPNYALWDEAKNDWDSCGNTEKIVALGDKRIYVAAWKAYEYHPSGTPEGKHWCLPAAGVFQSVSNNLDAINHGYRKMGQRMLSSATNAYYDSSSVWTSTEKQAERAFAFAPFNADPSFVMKDVSHKIRPVLEF